jgi:hypothetical protein
MSIKVITKDDFDRLSKVASDIANQTTVELLKRKKEIVLGPATGNSPPGMAEHLTKMADEA